MKKIFLLSTLALSTSAFAESDPYQACLDKAGASLLNFVQKKLQMFIKNKLLNLIMLFMQTIKKQILKKR